MGLWGSIVAVIFVALSIQATAAPVQQQQQPKAVPVFSQTGPDAEDYGEKLGYPVGLPFKNKPNMVGNYTHADRLWPTHTVAAAEQPSTLLRAPSELSANFKFGTETTSLMTYLDTNPTTGLLIAHNDVILFEHYQYGRTDQDRFLSQSMAKTLTGMLVGIAISEGAIHSIEIGRAHV